jgi:Flp pilus assembly protein TadG
MVRARAERGAAAVEAGLVSTILMPLMVGVLVYGNYFWHAQNVDAYAARIPTGQVSGSQLTCQQLVDRVKQTVLDNIDGLHADAPIQLADITAEVVQVLPTVGAVVHVSVRVPVATTLSSMLPNGGAVVTDTLLRLDDVTLSTSSC